MKYIIAVALSLLIMIVPFGYVGQPVEAKENKIQCHLSAREIIRLTNVKRKEKGLKPFLINMKLVDSAEAKAKHMNKVKYWAHYAPDGTTWASFILDSGYKYEYAGENLAKNFCHSADVVEAWMNSPLHRENILREEYQEIGVFVSVLEMDGKKEGLIVQHFGTPYKNGLFNL